MLFTKCAIARNLIPACWFFSFYVYLFLSRSLIPFIPIKMCEGFSLFASFFLNESVVIFTNFLEFENI